VILLGLGEWPSWRLGPGGGPTDARIGNANYGAILSSWDLVFRTFVRPNDGRFEGPTLDAKTKCSEAWRTGAGNND